MILHSQSRLLTDYLWAMNKFSNTLHAQPGEPVSAITAITQENTTVFHGVMQSDGDCQKRDGVGSENLSACTLLEQSPTYREDIKASDAGVDPQASKVSEGAVYAPLKRHADLCSNSILTN